MGGQSPPTDVGTGRGTDHGSATRRLPVVMALALLPWTVVAVGDVVTFVFPFGLVNVDPLGLTTTYDYLFRFTEGLPDFLLAWPVAVVLYAVALASAVAGVAGREDGRVTAALLALAGASQLWTTLGFLRRPGYVALPVGTVVLWAVVWWYYSPDVRALLLFPRGD